MASVAVDLPALARQMRGAASDFLESLTVTQRAAVQGAFDTDELTDWTYLPGHRPGLLVVELDAAQRAFASQLLLTSYSARGADDVMNVLRTEAIRRGGDLDPRASSMLAAHTDPPYWLRVLGDPGGTAPWAWRLSGHHLVAQATVVGDAVATTPQFFGAQPARVESGPHEGFRSLPEEEDLARRLVTLLEDDQRRIAVLSTEAPFDIRSRHDPVATVASTPAGLPRAQMDTAQRELFEALIRQYLDRASTPIANRAWRDLLDAGLDQVTFGWAGGLDQGDGHYYSITGQTLLLEYDNTQDDANHIHSVWRDLRHDWAGDLLARHYRAHGHSHA